MEGRFEINCPRVFLKIFGEGDVSQKIAPTQHMVTGSSVDIEVIRTGFFLFYFFNKRYFKHLKHKQNKVIKTVFNFIFIL